MKRTTQEDLHQIGVLLNQGMTSKEISEKLGWSKQAIDKWRQRIKLGTTDVKMGRPPKGSMSSFPQHVKDKVKGIREEFELKGSKMIQNELLDDNKLSCTVIPSISSVYRYLKDLGLIKNNEKHETQVVQRKVVAKEPHDIWQLDGQGNEEVNGLGTYAILNAKDAYSGLHTSVYPAKMSSIRGHPSTHHYQAAFRHGAMTYGLPRQLQTDHASVFYDNHSKSPFPTLFFLWLVALDVTPIFSGFNRPQDQGMVERSHRTMWGQLERATPYRNRESFFIHCQNRREWLNTKFNSSACGNKPVLKAFPKARHSGRYYYPQIERSLLSLDRVYDYLEKGVWWRRVSKDHTISLGKQVYYLQNAKPGALVHIKFRKSDTSLLISLVNELCFKCKLKGIGIDELVGEIDYFAPGTQLNIPFPNY